MTTMIDNYIDSKIKLLNEINLTEINVAIQLIKDKINLNKKIITCGNGGSAHTASHYITDWNKMYNLATGSKIRGISLCDNIGLVTAFANDSSYDEIFSGQLNSIADFGDLLIVISGSGNSKNVINAVRYANDIGVDTLGIVGYDGGVIKSLVKNYVHINSFDMQLCEDMHLMFGHLVMKSICIS